MASKVASKRIKALMPDDRKAELVARCRQFEQANNPFEATNAVCAEVLGALWEFAAERGHLEILLNRISKEEKTPLVVKMTKA